MDILHVRQLLPIVRNNNRWLIASILRTVFFIFYYLQNLFYLPYTLSINENVVNVNILFNIHDIIFDYV
jgi:hypothetical protein